jgi:hypothetical protein
MAIDEFNSAIIIELIISIYLFLVTGVGIHQIGIVVCAVCIFYTVLVISSIPSMDTYRFPDSRPSNLSKNFSMPFKSMA